MNVDVDTRARDRAGNIGVKRTAVFDDGVLRRASPADRRATETRSTAVHVARVERRANSTQSRRTEADDVDRRPARVGVAARAWQPASGALARRRTPQRRKEKERGASKTHRARCSDVLHGATLRQRDDVEVQDAGVRARQDDRALRVEQVELLDALHRRDRLVADAARLGRRRAR